MRDSPTILSVDRVSTIPLISITVKASPIIVTLGRYDSTNVVLHQVCALEIWIYVLARYLEIVVNIRLKS